MTLRIIVAGSRTFTDQARADREIDAFFSQILSKIQEPAEKIEFISGGCRGADMLGENYARLRRYPIVRMDAEWDKYGKAAGPIRNEEMCRYAALEKGFLIAFWDGKSAGTRNIIARAKEKNLMVKIVFV